MTESDSPIFGLVCLEYPEIEWMQDTVTYYSYGGDRMRKVAISPLRACFHGD